MTTDLGYGRGWAADDAAASIFRIDSQLGRPVQITEAGRSAEDADANYARWLAYQQGGPWAPYALPASQSVHCKGEATDSDESSAPWYPNGWRETARYADDRDEPWHREYFPELDEHINDKITTTPITPIRKRQTMLHAAYRTDDGSIIIQATPGATLQGLGPTEWKGIVAANPGASASQINNGERDGLISKYGINWK